MSFRSPLMLLALLAVPALLAYLAVLRRRSARAAIVYTNVDLLAEVAGPRRRWRRFVPLVLLLLAVSTATAALARPQVRLTSVERHSTVVLLVDVSGSMNARDVEPTRLDAAVSAMRMFLDRLPPQVDVGLVQFSSEPEVIQRPTQDRDLVRTSLGYMLPESGTAIGDGLAAAARLVHGSGAIVLLSDGTQSRGIGILSPLAGAARARAAGARVDTIALGTPSGELLFYTGRVSVPPDPALMRAIAHAAGGRSFTAKTSAQLVGIYSHLGRTLARHTSTHDIGSWFAGAAALLLLAALGFGRLFGPTLP